MCWFYYCVPYIQKKVHQLIACHYLIYIYLHFLLCVSWDERTGLGSVCRLFIGPIIKLKIANPDCPFLRLKGFIKHRAGQHHEEYVPNAKIHKKILTVGRRSTCKCDFADETGKS